MRVVLLTTSHQEGGLIPGSISPGSFLMGSVCPQRAHIPAFPCSVAGAGPGAGHASAASDLSVWVSLSTSLG